MTPCSLRSIESIVLKIAPTCSIVMDPEPSPCGRRFVDFFLGRKHVFLESRPDAVIGVYDFGSSLEKPRGYFLNPIEAAIEILRALK